MTGTIGFCLGGTLALDLAGSRSDVATVSYYGFVRGLGGPGVTTAPMDRVATMKGPILAFWGESDELMDMGDVEEFAKAMAHRGVDYEHVVYPGVGHGFLAQSNLEPESPVAGPALDSWERTLAFFARHLGGGPL